MPAKMRSPSSTCPMIVGFRRIAICLTTGTASSSRAIFGRNNSNESALPRAKQANNSECSPPTIGVRNQCADGNAEDRGQHDPETDHRDRFPCLFVSHDLNRGVTRQRPKDRESQRGNKASKRHHPKIWSRRCQNIRKSEQQ